MYFGCAIARGNNEFRWPPSQNESARAATADK